VDIERLVRGCGVEFVEVTDPYDYEATEKALQRAKTYSIDEGNGVSVVITRRPCVPMSGVEVSSDRFAVNGDCDLCMTCIRDLECPAFQYIKADKRIEINTDLCAGCGFCVNICPSQAVGLKES
jgi:indolepyruvate ferredoxin oxidoreductase alpha subunit